MELVFKCIWGAYEPQVSQKKKQSIGGKKKLPLQARAKLFLFLYSCGLILKETSRTRLVHRIVTCFVSNNSRGDEQAGFPTLRFLICSSNSSWYATGHAFSPLITMTCFLLSVGWTAGYDLILNLLMVPKRKANDRAAVG